MFKSRGLKGWIMPALVGGTIIYESSCSQVAGPEVPGIDKVEHALVYGLLATLVVRNEFLPKYAWLAVLMVSLFGVSDEWHQSFTPGRSVEFADWLADTIGAGLAVTLYVYWGWYHRLLEFTLIYGSEGGAVRSPEVLEQTRKSEKN